MIENDLNLLKLLVVLNEQRQTILAAKQMRLSQPTISAMLKKLRIEFNDELFIRNKNQLEPTSKCEKILTQLPEIFNRLDTLYLDNTDWSFADISGEIQLYFPAPLIDLIAPPLLIKLYQNAPHLTVECAVWTSDTERALSQEQSSWGINYLPVRSTKNLIEKHLFDDRFMFVMRKEHPLEASNLEEVVQYPLCVTIIPGFSEGSRMEMMIKRYKMDKRVNARLSDLSSMFNLLRNSDFIGATSSLYQSYLPDDIRSEPLPPEINPRILDKPLAFFCSQRNNANPLYNWLYSEIRTVIEALDSKRNHARS